MDLIRCFFSFQNHYQHLFVPITARFLLCLLFICGHKFTRHCQKLRPRTWCALLFADALTANDSLELFKEFEILGTRFIVCVHFDCNLWVKQRLWFFNLSNFLLSSSIIFFFSGLVIIFYFILTDLPSVDTVPKVATWSQLPLFFGTVVYAFEGIGVVLPLENNMKNPESLAGLTGVLNTSMVITAALYTAVGFYGYLKYGAAVKATITLNLDPGSM